MEENTKIKKIDWLYLVDYIFVPIALCGLCYGLCYLFFYNGGIGAVLTTLVPTILAAIWWIFGGSFIFKQKTKELEKAFVATGYKRNHTFYGRGQTVVLDLEKGILGLAFFWNPNAIFIVPASRVERAWTDDGRSGSGFMEGSQQVSFNFIIDGIKIRVNTFTSNQRFRMDDKRILTGISKADMMVQSIELAKKNSKGASKTADSKSSKTETKSEATKTKETAKAEKTESKSTKSDEKSKK